MKLVKILNIKGALLDKYQLDNYLQKIASDHILQEKSDKKTFPVIRMEENFKFITQVYETLNKHLKLGINIHPAGEWLLDNYYIIEEIFKTIKKDLTITKYHNFVSISNGAYSGFARIYVLATEIVAYTDACLNAEVLKDILIAYQKKKTLNMEEIWSIGIFLQIAMIENIANICETIYSSQLQKYKVENIIERLVEYKTRDEQKFKIDKNYKNKVLESGQMKYPFIEHMSYRLRRYGRKTHKYLNILEEQVKKMGTTVSEVIKKEHFDIAVKKVSIGNCIKGLKQIQRINFLNIFEKINGVEEILRKDPVGIYPNMDYKTKVYYRNKIKEISKKTKISEIYITNKALELASQKEQEDKINKIDKKNLPDVKQYKSHVGYYIIDEGIQELYNCLQTNKKIKIKKNKEIKYISTMLILSIIISTIIILLMKKQINLGFSIIIGILCFIPVTQIVTEIMQYILNKIVKPKIVPKMDYSNGVPKENATMVIIPTIVKSGTKAKDLIKKLEVFYLANKSENMYYTLLADATSGSKKEESHDEDIIQTAKEEIKKLNNKYPDKDFGKFQFIYRKREWNEKEKCFLGWERKRGMINQFNEYLLGNIKNPFRANSIEEERRNERNVNIKYIITLDSDTNLVLNSGIELIGAAAHILNKPILNESKDLVIKGHGLIQPRIGIDLVSSRKSIFTKIFAGAGGIDPYANAISDVYQDNFDEGIFTGKGIYDLEVFSTVLKQEIPENTVLSHDLLEGNYLRCGLASDILLLDGYPYKYNTFMQRLHRWIRGDWQITRWIFPNIKDKEAKKKKNPLKILDRFKILDNIRRSLVEILAIFTMFILAVQKIVIDIKIWPIVSLMLVSITIPTILELINYVIYKKEGRSNNKLFSKTVVGAKGSIIRGIMLISFLPHKAYNCLDAIVRTCYRKWISKQNLLEWTTSEEAEQKANVDLLSYYKFMFVNVIAAIVSILLISNYKIGSLTVIFYLIPILWLLAPAILYYISKEEVQKAKVKLLNNQEIEYVLDIGKRTWKFFEKYMNKENNFLPPDNYQEDRAEKIVYRTSSTNIGLGLLSVVSAYDLGYIELDKAINLINNILDTITKLPKWNGHLYNWYNTNTLEPLLPRYISTVDSGNFIGYLYVLEEFLKNIVDNKLKKKKYEKIDVVETLITIVQQLIIKTDFSVLYDKEKEIFSIGYNIEENKITDTYYDLLASEARQASIIAIAKHDVPEKHWQNLSRTLTIMNGYKGLVSWSATAFEYLMPNINIKSYEGSLLDESCKFMIMSQREYAKQLGIPWGISESAFNLKDLNSNYQYKAFGVPWLGLKRGLADEMVVSSYGSILAIADMPKEVIQNLKILEEEGMYDKYGFYEAIDYTPTRLRNNQKSEVVKTYMAHHQALILLSINNLINNYILQERFIQNPQIKAVDILLQERMPENVIITKEKKEKIEKLKNIDYENYTVKTINKLNYNLNNFNTISNENYTIVMNEKGEGFSKYKDIYVNRYKYTNDCNQGIEFFIKNIRTKKIWSTIYDENILKPDKYEINFMPDENKMVRNDENITTTCKTIVAPNNPVEIRKIELKNNSNIEEILEVTSIFEPVLSSVQQDNSHMAFNKLFLKYEYLEDTNSILIKRNKRGDTKPIYLGVNLCTTDEMVGELEYEIDKEKLNAGVALGIPNMIENSVPFSKSLGLTVDPVVALKRTIKIKPNEKVDLNLIITISEDKEKVKENLKEYTNTENIKREFELSRARVEEEARYLGIKGSDIQVYQKLLSYLIVQNPMKKMYLKDKSRQYKREDLWKYGISGDYPILLVKIKDANDIYVIKEVLKAYEFFRVKNIKIEIIILNEEQNVYERYVREAIESEILNRHLNVNEGIYLLNADELEDKEILEFTANFIINVSKGNIKTIIRDQEEEYMEKIKKVPKQIKNEQVEFNFEKSTNLIHEQQLKYDNEYGAFSEDGKEYIIRMNANNRPPVVWSHIIANENFGTVVSNNTSGFTWYKNSRLNRISDWSNNIIQDIPSEIIYIQDKDYNKNWSLCPNLNKDDEEYNIVYGFGYAKYINMRLGLLQELEIFVPRQDNIKVNLLKIKNTQPKKRKLRLIYYVKPVLGEDIVKTTGNIYIEYDNDSNMIFAKNLYSLDMEESKCYVSSSQKIKSYTGNKKSFIGKGNIQAPEALEDQVLNKENSLGTLACIAIEIEVELEAYEDKQISIFLGSEEAKEKMEEISRKYSNIENCKKELEEVKEYWAKKLRIVQVKTPLESMNILLNGWLVYQTIACRLWGRSAFYQSGGAYGYRDQLQDTMGIKFIEPEFMKKQIMLHAKHQFIEGDVEHWWHEETNKGIRTRFSDDLLWLPYVTSEYVKFTGDESILEKEVPYVKGELLQDGQDEIYDEHLQTEEVESIYKHCIRAIDKSISLGKHGIPKIGSGDWNDGFSTVGNKGEGESIWLGFFLYEVLNRFIPICELKKDIKKQQEYLEIQNKLKVALNTKGWDGRWYRRAYTDDGKILGSIENEECKIDSIAQSWSVISGAGDNDKKYISMDNLEKYLVDKQNGLIKLLDPAFDKSELEPGYIKSYLPGVRENGGQYTHGAIWAIIAQAILGFGDKALEYFKIINPIEHSRTKAAVNKYKVEPYVIAADVYGVGNLVGRGGWTWYTGSSSWMYKAGIEYILGLKIINNTLSIKPCIPKEWSEYSIRYVYKSSIYNIKVKNLQQKNKGIEKFIVNGEEIDKKEIKLIDDGKINDIEVIM
ncbi:MAG: hypothetical protein HFJ53_08180 [Clostridia bacterium]|nr:hypothetical protein [Clostridia bacterium]